jgi:hypothetical protein
MELTLISRVGARGRSLSRRSGGIALMAALFCSGFQFFHSFGKAFETQPLAPYLLLEVTLGALILLAVVSIANQAAAGTLRTLDLFFFLFPLCWLTLSAAFAWFAFNQPPIYAISEDRRILTFLYWFAFDPVRRRFGLTAVDILLSLFICACIYLVTALGLQLLVPDELGRRALPDLDTRRLRMSAPGDCFAITFLSGLVGWLVSKRRSIAGAAAIIGLIGLLQVAQTRQLTLAALATGFIFIWLCRPNWALVAGLGGAVAFAATVWLRGPVFFEQIADALLPNISEFFGQHLADNARVNTFHIVVRLLADNHLLGLGAVSLLYDGGLARLYGRNFFVNDVGILGECFRVGFFYLGFVCAYAAVAARLWQRIVLREHRLLIAALYSFYFLLAPTDGFFYRLGFVHAFLFLLMSAAGSQSRDSLSHIRHLPMQPAVFAEQA